MTSALTSPYFINRQPPPPCVPEIARNGATRRLALTLKQLNRQNTIRCHVDRHLPSSRIANGPVKGLECCRSLFVCRTNKLRRRQWGKASRRYCPHFPNRRLPLFNVEWSLFVTPKHITLSLVWEEFSEMRHECVCQLLSLELGQEHCHNWLTIACVQSRKSDLGVANTLYLRARPTI